MENLEVKSKLEELAKEISILRIIILNLVTKIEKTQKKNKIDKDIIKKNMLDVKKIVSDAKYAPNSPDEWFMKNIAPKVLKEEENKENKEKENKEKGETSGTKDE